MKLKGPSVSAEASGSLADVLTYSHSNKTGYAKKHAAPSNPRSGAQVSIRAAVKFLSQRWHYLSPAQKLTWAPQAETLHVAHYHAFIRYNMKRWGNFKSPTKEHPAAETSTVPKVPYTDGVSGIKMATINEYVQIPPPLWGYILMRSTANITAPDRDLVVALFPYFWPDTNTFYVDQLKTGTYYYRALAFNHDGISSGQGRQWIAVVA